MMINLNMSANSGQNVSQIRNESLGLSKIHSHMQEQRTCIRGPRKPIEKYGRDSLSTDY
jgi:hypothetical protein